MIRAAGAEINFLSSYSPDFNPIENVFYIYLKMLKRLHNMHWFDAHFLALHAVNELHGRAFFGKCDIPCCRGFVGLDTGECEKRTFSMIAAVAFFLTSQQMLQNMNIVAILIFF